MARATNIPTASGAVTTADGRYFGHSELRETSNHAAVVELREGTSTGTVLAAWSFAGNGQTNAVYTGPTGIFCRGGIYFVLASGTGVLEGSVWID